MVKKIIVLVISALFLVSGASALSPISFGIKAGLSYQEVDLGGARNGDYLLSASSKTGFYAGFTSRIDLVVLHIQPEINYMMNRYELTATPFTSPGFGTAVYASTSTVKLNTVEVPVLLGKKFLFMRLQAGPVFNVMSEASVSSPKSAVPGQTPPKHSVVTYTKPSVGYMVGVAADIFKISISARYSGEFSKPEQCISIGGTQGTVVKTKMNAWLLSVGLNF